MIQEKNSQLIIAYVVYFVINFIYQSIWPLLSTSSFIVLE